MIEIIPNWHPIFVHFTVALLSLTFVFHILWYFMPEGNNKQEIVILARWNLWLGAGFGIITVIAGWLAYNSVVHDTPSHEAMTVHRNWALVTLTLFIILSVWSYFSDHKKVLPGKFFLLVLVIGTMFLATTAWHGAETVYRYGIGVMSLPMDENNKEEHTHGGNDTNTTEGKINNRYVESEQNKADRYVHDNHQHGE